MIQTTEVSITYKGDGVQTSFPYPYPYRNSDDIIGYIINDVGYEKRITNNFKYDKVSNIYQYPLAGDPLAAPYSIKLIRETPQQQNADLPGKLPFSLIEKSLDWIIMILQEIGSRCNSLWHIRNDCKLSETNARNSASAAAESEENAADSENLAKKWAMSPVSPDGVADTDSPTGYTQSAKIWAALSKEYAGLSKFKLPIGYYNSVAEMKASETAFVGRPCVTLGYYAPNDCGGAVYIIGQKKETDTDDGGSIIILDNGNVAVMLADGDVNVKQFGAKGDGTNDDTTAFKNALASAKNKSFIVPTGTYAINENLFADDVNEVIDAGTYTNIKPVYPRRDVQLTATDNIELVSNVVLGDEGFEGFCYDSTLNQFICAGKKTDDSEQKLYILNPDDFNIVKSKEYTELAHANTLTYNPDNKKIYCLYDSNKIAVINEESLAIEQTITKTEGLTGLAYDPVTKLYVGFANWVSNNNYFYIYDSTLTTVLRKIEYDTQLTTNGLCMHDGKIIALFLGQIQEFDILTGLVKTLKYDDKVELEDVCTKDGELFFNSNRLGSGICTFFALGKSSSEEQILRKNTEIVTDVDLDNIKIDGAYKILLSDVDSWETYHCPERAINFHLIVNSINKREHIIQEAYRISPQEKNHIFYRIYEDNEWTPWFSKPKFIDSSHVYNIGTWYGSGFITGNNGKVYVTIPCVAHFPAKINSLSITGKLTIRQNNNYIVTAMDISSATVTYNGARLINLEIPITAQDITINNSSCGIELTNMVLSVS